MIAVTERTGPAAHAWHMSIRERRRVMIVPIVALVLAFVLAACSPGADRAEPDAQPSEGAREDVPSALDDPGDAAFPTPLIDLEHLLSGGPPPDGIPPIDKPRFQSAAEVDWLEPTEPVLSLTVGSETRAYPVQVMTWHEIVNDTVGGAPVAVTYCPLCNSGVAFERRVDGRLLDFGTSGMLYADNLVMYDRQTESLWPQLTGQASVGRPHRHPARGDPDGRRRLAAVPRRPPRRAVLTTDTGFNRDYGRNPYVGYDRPDGELLFELPPGADGRLPVKERVIGIRVGDQGSGRPRDRVADAGVVEVSVGGRDLVVLHVPGQASALDGQTIPEEDIGSVGVFQPSARRARSSPSSSGGGGVRRPRRPARRWNVLGEAVDGRLRGARLPAQRHLDTFWFAWVAFQPDTRLD